MGMLQVFFNAYALFDPGSTLYFVTPLVARKFDVLLDILIEPFLICSTMGDSVLQKESIRNFL